MAQGELEKKIELNWLSAFYGGLLTPKQRDVMRMHCEEDLSLGEIAQEAGISSLSWRESWAWRRGLPACSGDWNNASRRWRKSATTTPGR